MRTRNDIDAALSGLGLTPWTPGETGAANQLRLQQNARTRATARGDQFMPNFGPQGFDEYSEAALEEREQNPDANVILRQAQMTPTLAQWRDSGASKPNYVGLPSMLTPEQKLQAALGPETKTYEDWLYPRGRNPNQRHPQPQPVAPVVPSKPVGRQ